MRLVRSSYWFEMHWHFCLIASILLVQVRTSSGCSAGELTGPVNNKVIFRKSGLVCDNNSCFLNTSRSISGEYFVLKSLSISNKVLTVTDEEWKNSGLAVKEFELHRSTPSLKVSFEKSRYDQLFNISTVYVLLCKTKKPEKVILSDSASDHFAERKESYINQFYVMPFLWNNTVRKLPTEFNATVYLTTDLNPSSRKKLNPVKEFEHRTCVGWDRAQSKMSTITCALFDLSVNSTSCSCNQTGWFAIQSTSWVPKDEYLKLIGTGMMVMSSIFIVFTATLLIKFRSALKQNQARTSLQINLCVAFLLQQVALEFGHTVHILTPMHTVLCLAAACIHTYFVYVSAMWMFFEGLLLFTRVCLPFALNLPSKVYAAVAAWIMPFCLISVIVVVELTKEEHKLCKISAEYHEALHNPNLVMNVARYKTHFFPAIGAKCALCFVMGSFVSIFISISMISLVFLMNIVILITVSIVVWTKSKIKESSNTVNDESPSYVTVQSVALLTLFLGLPWLASLFIVLTDFIKLSPCPDNNCISFQILLLHFVVTALQGPLIFYMYFYRNEALKEAASRRWRYICRS